MEIANQSCFVFQTDSKIVQDVYRNQPNYLIEYNTQCTNKDYCAVYFCSNDIYYPNTEEIFKKRIIEKNFFEWYGSRIKKRINISSYEMYSNNGIWQESIQT